MDIMDIDLNKIFEGGSNVALLIFLLRLDRRLVKIESFLKHKFKFGG